MTLARLGRVVTGAARDLAAFAMPQRCPACDQECVADRLLCAGCLAQVPVLSIPLCARCLARGGSGPGCVRHPAFQVWPAWVYDERAAAVVHALKYAGRPRLAETLGEAMARALPPATRPDLVLAVPLHPARRRERGYNQAACLARALGERIGAPCLEGELVRTRPTRPQAALDWKSRRENVAGAFRVRNAGVLAGREVVVVDDVLTTGATLEACLSVLDDAGAHAAGVTLAWAQ